MATETRSFDASNVTTNGIASISGDDVTVYNSSITAGEAGSVFFNDQVSLNSDFTATFDTIMTGPDGIAFVLHNDPAGASALGGVGIGMGHAGIQDGIAIEFDNYFNGAGFGNVDINDNSSVIRDTDFAATNAAGNISTQVDLDPIADLNDGSTHSIEIRWDASTNTMSWDLNGTNVSSRTFSEAELDSLFGADRSVFLGLTGAKFVGGTGEVNDFSISANFVCFASGTRILTDRGEVPVEELQVGDLVQTLDNGMQPIRWMGSKALDAGMLAQNPKLRPIHIRAGALAPGMPEVDLTVSPQHRILLRSKIAQRMFGSDEVLVPAVKLLGLDGVSQAGADESVTYWHILLDDHQILTANGAPAESLLLGPQALNAVSPDALREIEVLFPEILDPEFAPVSARVIARNGRKLDTLLSRHAKNHKPLYDARDLHPA